MGAKHGDDAVRQISKAIGWLALASLIVLTLFGLWGAPPDAVQGDAQRLMYLHVPAAWIAYLAFGVTSLGSALWLWPRTRATVWDRVAGASAELGVIFTALTLVLGSLWGSAIGSRAGAFAACSCARRLRMERWTRRECC